MISLFVGAVIANIVVEYYYPNVGTIGNLEVYINNIQYLDQDEINWGVCQPGYMYWKNMTVINMGNTALNVSILPEGLQPNWTLSWDANHKLLAFGEVATGWLNLSIPIEAMGWGTWGFRLVGEQT